MFYSFALQFIHLWKNLAVYVCFDYMDFIFIISIVLSSHISSLLMPHKLSPDFVVWLCSSALKNSLLVCKK